MLEFVDKSGTSSRFADVVKPEQIINMDAIAREALERGIKLHNEGRGKEAEPEFRRAIELNPRNIEELHNQIVKGFDVSGTLDNFIFAMHLVLRLDSGYEAARNNLAIAYENQGVIEANRGNLHAAMRKYREALAIAVSPEIVSCIRQNLAIAWTELGIQEYKNGQFVGLPNYMGLAYEADPNEITKRNFARAYACLALWGLDQNNLEAAREFLQIAFDIAAVTPDNYGLLPSDSGLLEKAIIEFLERGDEGFSFDLQTRRIEFHMPQMRQQDYLIAA
jgi:tetratricopeptide (TPR) repeat protein